MSKPKIFSGATWAKTEEEIIQLGTEELQRNYQMTPKMVSILVGDNPASLLYSGLKLKAAKRINADFILKHFTKDATFQEIASYITKKAQDPSIHGIMIQLPLPQNLLSKTSDLINHIPPQKDVDGLRLNSPFDHPTAKAIFDILETISEKDDQILLIGSTGMVGRSLTKILNKNDIVFTGCDKEEKNLREKTLSADIIISATGVPKLIKADMVKKGVKIIDVGSPQGDVDFEAIKNIASFITPTRGGVGPLTIAHLLSNLLTAAMEQKLNP